jgi:single-strand DNA-binding protein
MATAKGKTQSTDRKQKPHSGERTAESKGPVAKVGNLTREPELRFGLDTGNPYCRFGLAVERPKEPGNWSGERETTFFDATAFGTLAEHVAELGKGTRVLVIGKAELEHWTDDEGTERTTKRILVDACGPDLRWATATVKRDGKKKRNSEPASAEPDGDSEEF